MSNVVYLSTHPRVPVKEGAATWLEDAKETSARIHGQSEVIELLKKEASILMDEAFRARALGQESVGKQREEIAKYVLSLVASLPTKLRAQ